MIIEIIKLFIQLIVIGILGGAVSWMYSKIQKNRELRIQLIKELTKIQGDFLQLRYEYNTFHITWNNDCIERVALEMSIDEIIKLKWIKYEKSCALLGEFQSIKPLLIEFFPDVENELNEMHQSFQEWRRRIREDKPVFQTNEGKSDERFKEHKTLYNHVISKLKMRI